jgi:hypothetical protein
MIGWQKAGLSLESDNTIKSYYTDGTSEFRNNLVHAVVSPYKSGNVVLATDALLQARAESQGCKTYTSGDSAMLTAPYYSTAPKFLPVTGSPALTGASFTGMNSYFVATTFVGAMGTTDWTATWTNWDPQNKAY